MNKVKSMLILIFAVLISNFGIVYASGLADNGIVNVASPEVNENVKITSASHPMGSKYGSTYTKLEGFIDGNKISSALSQNLALFSYGTAEGVDEIYTPLYDPKNPIQVCVDLGEEYDISSIVVYGRPMDISLSNTRVYASNDEKAATADWQSAELYEIKDFGTGTASMGNMVPANGNLTVKFTENPIADPTDLSKENKVYPNYLERSKENNRFRYIIISRGSKTSVGYTEMIFGEIEVFAKMPMEFAADCNVTCDGENYIGEYYIENNREESPELDMVVILASYDENNKMKNISVLPVKADSNVKNSTLSVSAEDAVKAKMYIWSGTSLVDGGEISYASSSNE